MEEDGGSFESLSTIQPNIRRLDPFWATRLWQKLIQEALLKVKVCKQRHFLKNYDEVFNGEDLVNSVFQFLKECKSELDVDRINRSNASKVCQVLMDKKFFESVVPKGNQKFEDSSSKFYRFIPDQITEEIVSKGDEIKEKRSLVVEEEKENVFASPCNLNSTFTPDTKFSSKRRSVRLKTPLLRVRDTKPSPVRFSRRNARDPDEEAILSLRDTALAILLQLVEVPMLESLLSVPFDLPELAEAPQPFIFENDFTPRKIKPTKIDYRGPVADLPWVKASSLCLDGRYPAGITGLWSLQACKVLCYKSVVERFSCSAESLIPGEYFSICIPIVQMLKAEQRKRALYALQLLILHLPWKRRKQLQHLLQFLHLVVDDIFVSVDKMVTNYEAVLRDFLTVVFKHPLVSEETQKILFDFLLLKSETVFNIPSCLQKIKESGLKFCETVSVQDYETTSVEYTKRSLVDLASSVADSTEIKLADKKLWFKKLKKHHHNAYESCNFDD
ncbi:DEP domain-containing protein 7-like [Argiope bruennichi]|uniref:DEP domain-containing protein 7 n=1 Tax=Argiope bruennichi TaxID=94029 RepID=A0A8T0FML7_ARGBR|nr:DEP domain-containing protein 7-like [Argiope bruennichi]KAF8792156.1 DEP domain-containing protein 7 [Argiope bruennichi]